MQDTVTPVKAAFAALIFNVALNLILMFPLKAGGLALATSIAGFVNLVLLLQSLGRRIGDFRNQEIIRSSVKIALSSLIMTAALFLLLLIIKVDSSIKGAFNLAFIIMAGVFAYLLSSIILKVEETKAVLLWIKRR
jgi:putative peptidoglycan lipid II flippase